LVWFGLGMMKWFRGYVAGYSIIVGRGGSSNLL